MKKIILIIAIGLLSFPLLGQHYVNNRNVGTIPSYTFAADHSYIFKLPVSTHFSAQFIWSGEDSLNAVVVPYVSNDGSTWVKFADASAHVTDSLVLSKASGSGIISLPAPYGTVERYLKFEIKHGTNTGGTISLILNEFH